MTNADLFWNLLQMYLIEKEKNSKKKENTNDKDDEYKKLHSQYFSKIFFKVLTNHPFYVNIIKDLV